MVVTHWHGTKQRGLSKAMVYLGNRCIDRSKTLQNFVKIRDGVVVHFSKVRSKTLQNFVKIRDSLVGHFSKIKPLDME